MRSAYCDEVGEEIVQFRTRDQMWAWLRKHHATSAGVWVRVSRSASRLESVTFHELLEAGLAFGWSESKRRAYDADSYLQRFTPRRTVGTASERNLRIVAALEREGRMTPAGRIALGLEPHG